MNRRAQVVISTVLEHRGRFQTLACWSYDSEHRGWAIGILGTLMRIWDEFSELLSTAWLSLGSGNCELD